VLHVIPSVSIADGGPSKAIALMERALSEAGIRVTTLTTDHNLDSKGMGCKQLAVVANGACRIYARKWTNWYKVAPGVVPYLMSHIRSFDVVHIHALFSFSSTVAAAIARGFGIPYVIRPLGALGAYGTSQRRRRLKRLSIALVEGPILRAAAAVHFTSRAEMEEAKDLGLVFHGVVIPLGIEPEPQTSLMNMREAYPALTDRRAILFLSRLDPKKNVEALIDAFASSDELKSVSALLVAGTGDCSYVDGLKQRANAAGVGDLVLWLGHVDGARKAAAFAAADIFVLPSSSENFGIAAVEAMLAGLPCVLSSGVAIAADAAGAGGAVVVEPVPQALAMAIGATLRNEGARKTMGGRAREFALSAYSTSAMARRLIDLYEGVASLRRRRGA
jgi:glycosyltransferase involved in cell wall biosynthesis